MLKQRQLNLFLIAGLLVSARINLEQPPCSSLERAHHVFGNVWCVQIYCLSTIHYTK